MQILPPFAHFMSKWNFFTPHYFLLKIFFLPYIFNRNIITSRTPGKAGNTGHGPEYHKPPPVDVPHKYRARQAASGQGGGRMPEEAQMQRESTRRQGRGNEVGPGEGAPARMAVCDTAGRKAAGGGDESAARVDASCEQPVKPRRFLTSHRPRMTGDGNGTGNSSTTTPIMAILKARFQKCKSRTGSNGLPTCWRR